METEAGVSGSDETRAAEIRTFLIADVRGYTRFTQDRGDEAAAKLTDRFATIARSEIDRRRGSDLEFRGDEVLAVFASPRQALRAAAAMQSRFVQETLADPAFPLTVGIGLDAGEAVPVAHGYRGGALNQAARLCSLARPGEVLASPEVVHLARKVEGLRYEDHGQHRLKGLSEPLTVIRVVPEDEDPVGLLAPFVAGAAPEPKPVGPGEPVFVGRDREVAELVSGLQAALANQGRLYLLSGEPGIGKTQLSDEIASRAREHGARVLWGRCWEAGGAPAYWPWVQAIRSYMRDRELEALRTELGAGASDIAQMVPEVRELFPDVPVAPPLDPDSARFRLFDSTTGFFRNAAAVRPIVLVLDDLHAADQPSLLLLEFLVSQLTDASMLVLGIYRDVDPPIGHDLASTLAQLTREKATRQLRLGGLPEGEVRKLIRDTSGFDAPSDLVSAIFRQTEGNPLFVGEVVRLLDSEGRLQLAEGSVRLGIPVGAREVIGRRLTRLSEGCMEVLTLASVVGREFGLDELSRITELPRDGLMATLDEAVAARVITEVPGSLGRLRFAHALIRDTVYEDLSPMRRVELHGRAGEVLEAIHAHDLEPHLAEIAHHFFESAPGGDPGRAVEYARRAGDRASALLAYEEAARLYRMALGALELTGEPEPGTRCDLLIVLGDAQMRAGAGPASQDAFVRAAEIARSADSPDRLARAALGYGGRFVWQRAGRDTRLVPLLLEALDALGETDDPLRVRLLARLSGALRDEPSRERRDALSQEAVDIARRLGDPGALAFALAARFTAIWGPDNAEEVLALANEVLELANRSGDLERQVEGHHLRFIVLVPLGERATADAALEASDRVAGELRQPMRDWYQSVHRTMLTLLEGRLAEAEEMVPRTLSVVTKAQSVDAEVSFRLQSWALRREQGRLEEVEPVIRRSVVDFPWYPMFRCVLANLLAELGLEAEAREVFDEVAADDFAILPVDLEWLFGMSLLPEVAVLLGDDRRVTALYDLLLPSAGLNALSPPELSTGPVARYLGVLAATAARYEDAARHFDDALDMCERMRARLWEARTQHDYARMLLARDRPGDREGAVQLLTDALETTKELGMSVVRANVEVVLAELGAIPSSRKRSDARKGTAAPPFTPSVFRREGEYWAIAYEGDGFRLRDTKGLRYIAQLLASPGREIHALDLAAEGAVDPRARGQAREAGLEMAGDGLEILDSQARRAYKERLEELEMELSEAESFNDFERGDQLRDEMEFITRELTGATGLGGRPRRTGSPAERARQSVTKAVKVALERIGEHSSSLRKHLETTIRTGTFCSYAPDPRVPVSWAL